jgi:dihydrolipoamide dehydrogenase
MSGHKHDLVVIGAGPGGYVAAIRAAQLGLDTACVELEPALGGTCLRVGCIPSKALLEASERYHEAKNGLADFGIKLGQVDLDLAQMLARKDSIVEGLTSGVAMLFKKNKVTRYFGHGCITAPGSVSVTGDQPVAIEAEHILIATGSKAASLRGVDFDGEYVGTSTESLAYANVPGELVVIGAGAIGLEMGSVWSRLGAKVKVLEYLDRILPGMDGQIAKEAQRVLAKQGLEFQLGVKVVGVRKDGDRRVVQIEGGQEVPCDRVLVSVGRIPNTDGLGLEGVGVHKDERGFVKVDPHFRTNVEGIFAIGDVIGGAMLAHKAEEEGIACVEQIVTGYGHVNYDAIPSVVYTHPEVAGVGKTEEQLKAAGVAYKVGSFPFKPNGRARAIGATDGRVKLLAEKETDRLLGAHILGAHAGDLIAELAVAIEFGATAEDVARCSHAHPSLAEIIKEAALATDGRALHM